MALVGCGSSGCMLGWMQQQPDQREESVEEVVNVRVLLEWGLGGLAVADLEGISDGC